MEAFKHGEPTWIQFYQIETEEVREGTIKKIAKKTKWERRQLTKD